MKLAIISGFMGRLQDRFCGYHEPRDIAAKLDAVKNVKGISGVELIYPHDFGDMGLLEAKLKETGLEVAAVNLNLKGSVEYVRGSLTSPRAEIRANAVRDLKGAMQAAKELGVNRVTVCPLADGHDYAFEVNYAKAWSWLVEAVCEAATSNPDVTIFVEYKANETRVRTTISNIGKALLLCNEIGQPNVGVTIDIGHALYAGENAAESLAMANYYGVPVYVHVNDNYRNWDWDLIPGSVNWFDLVEFMYYLQKLGYDGWLTFDVFPARMPAEGCFEVSVDFIKAAANAASKLDPAKLADFEAREDVAGLMNYLRRTLLKG